MTEVVPVYCLSDHLQPSDEPLDSLPKRPKSSDKELHEWFARCKDTVTKVELFDGGEDSEHFQTAVIIWMGFKTQHLATISRITRYDRTFVRTRVHRLRKAKIWLGGGWLAADKWFEDHKGDFYFFIDCLIGNGDLVRVQNEDGEFALQLPQSPEIIPIKEVEPQLATIS